MSLLYELITFSLLLTVCHMDICGRVMVYYVILEFLFKLKHICIACAKNFVYFSIRAYFFYFIYSLFKTLYINIIQFTLNFIKISIFLDLFNCFSFFAHNNLYPLSSFILETCVRVLFFLHLILFKYHLFIFKHHQEVIELSQNIFFPIIMLITNISYLII